jgi:hypothetical protein
LTVRCRTLSAARSARIHPSREWVAIAIAAAASIALSLWLTRGTTLHADDFSYWGSSYGLDVQRLLEPNNGHLILVPRLFWAIGLKLFGADYAVFRIVEAVGVASVGVLVFALARRRVGGAVALALAVPLLFFGSAWDATLAVAGIPAAYAITFGLAAMLVLLTRPRFADPLACFLLVLAVASFSEGLAFVVGAAVAILIASDRRWRVWVFLTPALLYLAWYLANPPGDGVIGGPRAENVLLIPSYVADAAGSMLAALTGLSHSFDVAPAGSPPPMSIDATWGPALVAVAAGALALAFRRRRPAVTFWPWLATLFALWVSFALVFTPILRGPDGARYTYAPAAVALVLAAEAAAPFRITRRAIAVVFAVVVAALGANLSTMIDAGDYLSDYASSARADLAAIEIARGHVSPTFAPSTGVLANLGILIHPGVDAGSYLASVDRNGSFADSIDELAAAPEASREEADQILGEALGLSLQPAPRAAGKGCRKLGAQAAVTGFELPAGGAVLRAPADGTVVLRRFADAYTVQVGALPAGASQALSIPTDAAPEPWWARLEAPAPVVVC